MTLYEMIKNLIRNIGILLFSLTGIPALRRFFLKQKSPLIRVLVFHEVKEGDIDKFESLLILFKDGFNVMTVRDFENEEFDKKKINLLLTFDDGYKSWLNILPVLQRHSLEALFFIPSGFIETEGDRDREEEYSRENLKLRPRVPLSWDGVRTLSSFGEIGGHTKNHFNLKKLDIETLEKEVFEDKKKIELEIGKSLKHFSYPFGTKDEISVESIQVVSRSGYDFAYTSKIDFYKNGQSKFLIPRTSVDPNFPKWLVLRLVGGSYDILKRMLS